MHSSRAGTAPNRAAQRANSDHQKSPPEPVRNNICLPGGHGVEGAWWGPLGVSGVSCGPRRRGCIGVRVQGLG